MRVSPVDLKATTPGMEFHQGLVTAYNADR